MSFLFNKVLKKNNIFFRIIYIIKIFIYNISFNIIYMFNNFMLKTKYRDKSIRLSISYLYRIKIDNKFLLVKSERRKNQLQPVGGCYKYYNSAKNLIDKLDIKIDNDLDLNCESNDLRLIIPSKNVKKIISWFITKQDREVTPIREFEEELLDTNILCPTENFYNNINYLFIKRKITKIKFNKSNMHNELRIIDIYEYKADFIQKKQLRKVSHEKKENCKFFTKKEILNIIKKNDNSYTIGIHSKFIL